MSNDESQAQPPDPLKKTPVPVTIVTKDPEGIPLPLPVKEVPKTTREAAYKWLAEQGVSTVLLFSIVSLLAFGVPMYVVPIIQSGYERNARSYESITKMHIDDNEKLIRTIMDSHERDRDAFRDAIRK